MGQLMISYRGLTPPDWVLQGIAAGRIAAVCLFRYNVESPGQLREATEAMHHAARRGGRLPPLIGIDQEGGQLMAVTGGATELPGNMALGATRSEELAERAGRVLGRELLALGCNLNFAPVLDLAGHADSVVVGTRAFGDDPRLVASLGSAMIRGLQRTGALATAKHFPGHGDTALDSHHAAPVVSRTLPELEGAELLPFRAAIAAGVGAVMSAHIRYSALDEAPATLSKEILTRLLRHDLGFAGLAITDAMDMKAVADGPSDLRAGQALEAGADLVLLGHLPRQPELLERLAGRFREDGLLRIEQARAGLHRDLPDPAVLGSREHRELAQEIADRAVTLLGGTTALPLALGDHETLGLVTSSAGDLTPADTSAGVELQLARQIRARHPRLKEMVVRPGAAGASPGSVLQATEECSAVIIGTMNALHDRHETALLRSLAASGRRVVHLALRSPADATIVPAGVPTICSYGLRPVNTEAAVRLLFGEIEARGSLPVRWTAGAAAPASGL